MYQYDEKVIKRTKQLLNILDLIKEDLEKFLKKFQNEHYARYDYSKEFASLGRLTLTFYKKSLFFRKTKDVKAFKK